MQVRTILNDDDAVSPVIGVILMVAITVILAAVIGTFVLGLGDQVSDTTPQASFSFDFDQGSSTSSCDTDIGSSNDGVLTITHDGGDAIDENSLSVTNGNNSISDLSDDNCGISDGSEVSAGTSFSTQIANDDTVRVIFEPQSGGDTATLGKFEGPEA